MSVRVRFAPSPTGYLHIGSARTALFNWLFAQRHGGEFILRIEDTDQKRSVPGAVEAIMDAMRWLGLEWDEGPDKGGPYGPYIQTERAALYRQWAQWLVEHGHGYRCYCTPDELAERRATQLARQSALGYDRRCRHLTTAEIAAYEAEGRPSVIRFAMPLEGETTIHDAIRGDITYANEQITDMVMLKSDGLPTYHLANVVDDHFMRITHILRADEWINTAPLHFNIYQAFGWELPVYAHLSLVLNPSGKGKLSKRTQAFGDAGQEVLVKVEEFREAGYLPEAVLNFLANVGWSFGDDVEYFTMAQAAERFALEDVNPAPARLPYSKLDWLNGQYVQALPPETLATKLAPFLAAAGLEIAHEALLPLMAPMSKRLKRLSDVDAFLGFLQPQRPFDLDAAALTDKKLPLPAALAAFQQARAFVAGCDSFTVPAIQAGLVPIGEQATTNGKAGPFLGKMRLAVTGQAVSPPLYESMVALGRERVLARLDATVALLSATAE